MRPARRWWDRAKLLVVVAALWWARKGDWDKAHKIVMDENGRDAASGRVAHASRFGRCAKDPLH